MFRVILYLVIVGVVAYAAAFFADQPGQVAITWQGWRVDTQLSVLAGVLALLVLAAIWPLLRTIFRVPSLIATLSRDRRALRGYRAVSNGLVAIGAGDADAARRYALEARRIAPADPLVLLLGAQTAQLSGDRGAAETAFRQMANRQDTKLLGLRGLYVEAQRRGDAAAAQAYAEEAAKASPGLGWAGQAALEFRCTAGDWVGALALLERQHRGGHLGKAAYRRQRAVLLTARAIALENGDRDLGRTLVLEAVGLEPTLVPAAALAGRRLAESGELRKASRIVEKAWKAQPHPDLAETYAHLRFGDSARDRLARVQTLAQKAPGHVESALAVAQAALDAQEFTRARTALRPFGSAPTQRVALLMAQLEQREHGDEGRAREWMARAVHAARDPRWTADGYVSDRWLPVSPVSGRLDAFQWRVPLSELAPARSFDDGALAALAPEAVPPEPVGVVVAEPMPPRPKDIPAAAVESVPSPATAAELFAETPAAAEPASAKIRRRAKAPVPVRAEPVIPLVHAPDDPGPLDESVSDTSVASPAQSAWPRSA